jgi:predicted nucleic acid-binding protein
MSIVLFDTNVLSELMRARPDPKVIAFIRMQRGSVISAVSVQELVYGAERASDPARRAKLIAWIASIRLQFAGRIVDIDSDIAESAGRLRAAAEAQGRPTEAIDALIAACAIGRGAAVATRNASDFEPMGVAVVNPWTL